MLTLYSGQSVLQISQASSSVLTKHPHKEKAESSSSSSIERYLPKTQLTKGREVGKRRQDIILDWRSRKTHFKMKIID